MRRRLYAWCICAALFLPLAGCGQKELPKQSVTGFYFDTVVTMTVYWKDDAPLQAALERCREFERTLSKTVEGSDVWKINHANGERVQVGGDTRDIIEKALEYSELSDGAFDITVEPCVALWDFTGEGRGTLPDPDALAEAAARVDYRTVDVNDDGVQLAPGQTIDLGAIAKGYIVGRIADFLEEQGVKSGFLNFGGNVQTIGSKPDGSPWKIGIQDPRSATGDSIAVAQIRGGAVVTSGIYERGFDLDGVRYHHLLDPATGWPIQNELAGVSIIADDSFDADALSTTLFALGTEKGLALAEELEGVEAIFITREDEISYTSGLEESLTLL